MVKKNALKPSQRFLLPRSHCSEIDRFNDSAKEVFPEGSWLSIYVDLELKGWTPVQISVIRNYLRSGWSLSQALRQASLVIGKCPLGF